MKLGKLVETSQSLSELVNVNLDITKAFELKKFIKQADEELKIFDEVKLELFKKLGTEKDGKITVPEDKKEELVNELNKILDKEIEIKIPEIKISDIKGEIKTNLLLQLDYIITE